VSQRNPPVFRSLEKNMKGSKTPRKVKAVGNADREILTRSILSLEQDRVGE